MTIQGVSDAIGGRREDVGFSLAVRRGSGMRGARMIRYRCWIMGFSWLGGFPCLA